MPMSSPSTGALPDGTTFRWLPSHPNRRVAACDRCHARVWWDAPRVQVHDGKGQFENKGTKSSYWCVACAIAMGIGSPPPSEATGEQEVLFG